MNYPELDGLLYHGSTAAVSRVDLKAGAAGKDFGPGFYTTTLRNQAEKFARIKARRMGAQTGFVSVFNFAPDPALRMKKFARADIEWLSFILKNRKLGPGGHEPPVLYDMVIGPVANDAVGLVLNQLLVGTYGDPLSMEAQNTAIRLLASEKRYNQVFFGTEESITGLRFQEAVEIGID